MEPFFVRYRNILVFLAILLAQIIGLAVQVRRTESGRSSADAGDGSGVRLIRLWADGLVTVDRLMSAVALTNAAAASGPLAPLKVAWVFNSPFCRSSTATRDCRSMTICFSCPISSLFDCDRAGIA